MKQFDGKVALATGGGSGLGEAIGKDLAARGAAVLLTDIDLKRAERVAAEIAGSGGIASAIQQDTARPEASARRAALCREQRRHWRSPGTGRRDGYRRLEPAV